MELRLTPETEAKLNGLARGTHRATDELLGEAVDHLVAYNEWFERKVRKSMAAARRKPNGSRRRSRRMARAAGTPLNADRVVRGRCFGFEYVEQDRSLETTNRVARVIYDSIQSLRTMPHRARKGRVEGTRELATLAADPQGWSPREGVLLKYRVTLRLARNWSARPTFARLLIIFRVSFFRVACQR